jgi:DNA-binding NarL/FixJ family response regulator
VLGEASDASEAWRQVKATVPELVIVDIRLQGDSGIELIRNLKALHPKIKILVLSTQDELVLAERAIRAGAMGFICKAESVRKILDAMHQVLRGKVYLSTRMTNHLIRRVSNGQRLDEDIVQGLTKLHVSPRTIETHRQNIKKKLDLQNSVQLVRSALKWTMGGG